MKTISQPQTSVLQLLLNKSEDVVSRASAPIKPKLRADQVAAVVAESGNPSGA
jgi:hypothetical protein